MRVGRGACDHEVDPDSSQFTAFSRQLAIAWTLSSSSRLAGPLARKLARPPEGWKRVSMTDDR
jgi:hypothetical protein